MDDIYIKKEDLNYWIGKYFNTDLISISDLLGLIEELDGELDHVYEKINQLESDIEENYKPISKAEQYDVNECDFI